MTDAQWMTIAADVLSVKYNWSGGEVGKGFIYSGHNDHNDIVPSAALTAAADDSDGYLGTGNSAATGANQKRTLYLSSGDVIWDFAGNVYEWMQDTITGAQPGLASDSTYVNVYATKNWNSSGMTWGVLPANSRPSVLAAVPGLSNINSWNSTNGIGQLYSNKNQTGSRAFLRGGDWNGGSLAGVLTLSLNYSPSSSSTRFGFRVVW